MHGNNPIRPPVSGDGSQLEVKHIFPTLQGEGPYVGHPAVFVRLGGCNLACSFCDTDFEDYAPMALAEIISEVKRLAKVPLPNPPPRGEGIVRKLVVITGGEPLRQNIVPLCEALLAEGFKVQIETNGTLYQKLPEAVHIVCSPKNSGGGYFPIRTDLLPRLQALKFIISKSDEKYNHVGEVGQAQFGTPVYVQPMDEYDAVRNAENRAYAMELAQRHGYVLSLQMHKILGIE
jgi:7-carboxy-7-deazaguanine synthase